MSEKSVYCKKELLCADGKCAQLSYYQVKEENCYGILVELRKEGNLEQLLVKKLTSSAEKMEQLLALLSQNSVTPCTLEEILRDQGNKF